MKYLFIIIALFISSCNTTDKRQMRINVYAFYGEYTTLECDSATMLNSKEAIFWANGYKGNVIAPNYLTISRY